MKAPEFVPNFDSASAMLRATARFLRGRDFPGLGVAPSMRLLGRAADRLPHRVREQIYIWSGWAEAIPEADLGEVRAEDVSRWVAAEYPHRRYPAILVGSASGAIVHLAAMLGAPWLPQTFFIAVRQSGVDPDDPRRALEWARRPAAALLEANPELVLHQMHDPSQDRLMIRRMEYFRVKRLRLGETYERFIEERLEPGGTIVVVDCGLTWPTTQAGERHVFQFGALGGATTEEFLHGGERVARFLERHGSPLRRWDPPEPDGDRPEAEWGFEPALLDDLRAAAERGGHRLVRLAFEEPEHPSPLVADLHRARHRERGLPGNRLLVESFIQLEPFWALRTGSVPFWMTFNMEPSAARLERYLDESEAFDEIHLMLFSHGVESIGFAPLDRWRGLLDRARERGAFVAVDEQRYPLDLGTYLRYNAELRRIPARHAIPGPVPFEHVEAFAAAAGTRSAVRIETV